MTFCPNCGLNGMVKVTRGSTRLLPFICWKRKYCLACGHMERMRK